MKAPIIIKTVIFVNVSVVTYIFTCLQYYKCNTTIDLKYIKCDWCKTSRTPGHVTMKLCVCVCENCVKTFKTWSSGR